jgi:oxygen-independent coproporphyrinogen-3 oxidase
MCYDSLSFDEFGKKHGIDFREYFASEIGKLNVLEDDGLIELDDAGISITSSWMTPVSALRRAGDCCFATLR